ncbi:uncharacterized protein V6R79_017283 [Siganus canaliculatus]
MKCWGLERTSCGDLDVDRLQRSSVNCASSQQLSPVNSEVSSLEDGSVTLSYTYSELKTSDYFFWYRQYPGKPPEFLISHTTAGTINEAVPGLKIKVEGNQINATISSAALSDSAVYYCAVRTTVTGNTKTLYKNLWSKDNTIFHQSH